MALIESFESHQISFPSFYKISPEHFLSEQYKIDKNKQQKNTCFELKSKSFRHVIYYVIGQLFTTSRLCTTYMYFVNLCYFFFFYKCRKTSRQLIYDRHTNLLHQNATIIKNDNRGTCYISSLKVKKKNTEDQRRNFFFIQTM